MRLLIISRKTLYLTIAIIIAILIIISLKFLLFTKAKDVFNPEVFYKGIKNEKNIAFACNIDWGNEYIPEMLRIFKENQVQITFFPTGKWAEKNPDLVSEIYKSGHEIGNHGYNHIDYDRLSYDQNKDEILKSHNIIKDIIKMNPIYFAPPSGAFNDNTIKAAKDLNYKVILWSIDTIDWRKDSYKDIIVKRVKDKLHQSAIVLMHPTAETVKALPEIIEYLFQNDYKIGTISSVMK